MTASALGFERPMANSLDAVSDRDFVLETLAAAAIAAVHLSRFAEEIVIWTSPLVGLIRLSDKFTTGSSIMPQKRNPDAAELVRAKVGRIVGALNALLMVMKGLPLAYQKDMQEDKEGTIDALNALALSLAAMTGMVRDAGAGQGAHEEGRRRPDIPPRPILPTGWCARCACRSARLTILPAASWPRRRRRMSRLRRLPLAGMREIEPRITEDVFAVLSVENSVKEPRQPSAELRRKTCAPRPEKLAAPARQGKALSGSSRGGGERSRLPGTICYGAAEFRSALCRIATTDHWPVLPSLQWPCCRARAAACGRKGPLDPPPVGGSAGRRDGCAPVAGAGRSRPAR